MVLLASSTPLYSQIIGVIAGLLAACSFAPYIRSILRGTTKPHRASYGIWSLLSMIILVSYFVTGARGTIWLLLSITSLQTIVFILSFKYGMGGFQRLDVVCLTGAVIGLILWAVTENPLTALYVSIFIEVLGWIPTIKKTYLYPQTENLATWLIALCAASVNLFAITEFALKIYLYPVYVLISDVIMVSLIVQRSQAKKLKSL